MTVPIPRKPGARLPHLDRERLHASARVFYACHDCWRQSRTVTG